MRKLFMLIACLGLAACVTTAPDPGVFDVAERSIAAAQAAGADELSPTELRFAEDRLQQAKAAMALKDYDDALMKIDESEINATLAIEKSRAALERRKVNELQRSNEALREELVKTYGEEFLQ
jgi:ferredoxin